MTSDSLATERPETPAPADVAAFHEDLRRRNLPILFWSAVFLHPMSLTWSLFDWLLAPQHWLQFFALRVAIVGVNTALVALVHRPGFRRYTLEAFFLWLLTFEVFIVPMLCTVRANFLAYSVGFTIVVFGVGLMPLWSPRRAIASVLSIFAAALVGFLISPPHASLGELVTGFFFFLTGALGSLVTAVSKYYLAQREYFARKELSAQRLITARLQAADRMKDEFIANVSHELRTPLNGIVGLSESMLDGATGELSADQRSNLEMIGVSGRRLANLVNDILDMSRLKNHELSVSTRSIDIRPVVETVLALMRPAANHKRLELRNALAAEVPPVWADEGRLQQILLNLVGNAVKFTSQGYVAVEAGQRGANLFISVRDTGIGVPDEKQALIFESFQQGDASIAREYGGTGLGLAISRQLVEVQGGQISLRSKRGEGAEFIFSLPISDIPAEQSKVVPRAAPAMRVPETPAMESDPEQQVYQPEPLEVVVPVTSNLEVLVVDDEPVNLQVVANYLATTSYQIRSVPSGVEALNLLKSGYRPDLILLDIMMPKLSGYEVLKTIRETLGPSELPVILLTAKNQVSDLIEGFESGANDYLTKPIAKGELLSRIKTHLHLSRLFSAYGRFVPHDFIRHLDRESIIDVKLGDQVQKEMSVLFSDIRSFTELSEAMSPRENFNFLNSFLMRVAPVIAESHGFIDQYIGDGVMALFPRRVDDALRAAAEVRRALRLYNEHRQQSGYRPIQLGTGVHVGPLILGTIGYERRMQTTVISDSVNQASRLEGLTKLFGLDIIVSEQAVKQLAEPSSFAFRSLGRMRVKGKRQFVSVYELLDGAPELELELKLKTRAIFEMGVEALSRGSSVEAQSAFENVLRINPQDSAAATLMGRAKAMAENPALQIRDGDLAERRH